MQNDSDKEVAIEVPPRSTFKKFYYKASRFVKKHPILIAAAIGLLVAAAIFTGGLVLVPAAVGVMAVAGTYVGAFIGGLILGGATAFCLSRKKTCSGFLASGLGMLGGVAAFIGLSLLIATSPLTGIIFCGIGLVTVMSGIFAGIGACISKCFTKNPTRDCGQGPGPVSETKSPKIGNSYQRMPEGLSPKVKNKNDSVASKPESSQKSYTGTVFRLDTNTAIAEPKPSKLSM